MKKTLSTILLLALLATPAAASYKDIDLDTQFSADELAPYDILQAADGQIRWLLKRNFQSIGTEATNHFVTIKVAQTATNSAFITATSAYGSTDGICVMDLTPAQTDTNGVFWYTAFWKDAAGKQYYSGTGTFTIVESTAAGGGTADPMTTPVNLSARSFTGNSGDINTSNSLMIVTGIWGRAISPTAPTHGQAYTWDTNTSSWTVSTIPTDHGGLTGLTDDDHPQYVETNETVNVVTIDSASARTNTFGGALTVLGNRVQNDSSTASGWGSTAFGASSDASGGWAFVSGTSSTASGDRSYAHGSNAEAAGDRSYAAGFWAVSSGNTAVAQGGYVDALGDYSRAVGYDTTASGTRSHAAGYKSTASHDDSFVWSDGTAQGSSTTKQYTVHADNGIRLLGAAGVEVEGPHTASSYTGDGNALTNLPTVIQHAPIALTSAATVTVSEAWSTNVFSLDMTQNVELAVSNVDTNTHADWILDVRMNSYTLSFGASITNLTNSDNFTRTNSYQSIVGNRPIYETVTEVW